MEQNYVTVERYMREKILDPVPKLNEEYSPTENKSLDRQQEDIHGHKLMEKELHGVLEKITKRLWLIISGLSEED